jgi:sugar-specific transcriptional regulator TrmB
MLANPEWDIGAIAAHLHFTEDAVRSRLDELARLTLLRPSWEDPGVLRAVSPEIGFASLLSRVESEMVERQHQIERTRAAIQAITAEHRATREHGGVISLIGLDEVRARLEELAYSAQSECASFTPGVGPRPDTHEAGKRANEVAIERGVAVRSIYQDSFRNDPATLSCARWLTDLGGRTRTVPTLPMMMVIIDRRIALLPIDPADAGKGALETQAAGLVTVAYSLFEQVWSVATPFGEPERTDINGLTPMELELIEILADGSTDEAASRKLDLSPR